MLKLNKKVMKITLLNVRRKEFSKPRGLIVALAVIYAT